MQLTREQALAILGLGATADADSATVQRAFERLARRYPQPSFPDRFRQLLEARDTLLDAGRSWRGLLEGNTLDLTWLLPRVAHTPEDRPPDRRTSLQRMLRAGYLAEPLSLGDDDDDDDEVIIPF